MGQGKKKIAYRLSKYASDRTVGKEIPETNFTEEQKTCQLKMKESNRKIRGKIRGGGESYD